jgi:hypothetical protein
MIESVDFSCWASKFMNLLLVLHHPSLLKASSMPTIVHDSQKTAALMLLVKAFENRSNFEPKHS